MNDGATYLEDVPVPSIDTNSILMNAPITGQDYLSFKITTPSLEKKGIDFTETVMTIYKIDTRIAPSTGSEVFTLHFSSPEGLRDSRVRVSKSYFSNSRSYWGYLHNWLEKARNNDKTNKFKRINKSIN